MRTTVTLDPDVAELIRRAMRERGMSFKQAVNDAIRAGVVGGAHAEARPFPTHDLGEPVVDVTAALRLAGELEDRSLAANLARGA